MNGTYRIPTAYRTAPPPVRLVRVYCRLPGGDLEAFDAAGPIGAAIAQVRDAGSPRALVLV